MEAYQIIILAAVGLALCFFGLRIKKIAFFVIWFLIGYQLMTLIMPNICEWFPAINDSELWQNLLPLAGGLLLSLVGFSIEKLCIGGICFCLTLIIAVHYFGNDISTLAIASIIGIILAGASAILVKPFTIVATSIAGALALTIVIFALFQNLNQQTLFFPILGGIAGISSLVQFFTTKKR